jgi:hypothetical protein
VTQNGVVKDGPLIVSGTSHVTKQLTENLLYVVAVAIVSSTGAVGPAASASFTNSGKQAKPSDVPSITGFEVGGEVRLQWAPATDFDLTGYEIRYGLSSGAWESATLLDRVATPSVRYATKVVPAGNWRFWIKGLDSVRSAQFPFGQESVNAAFVDMSVTSDANAFIAATSDDFASPLLFNVTLTAGGYETDFGATWNSLFTAALNTYTNPLATYHAAGTSLIVTETFDAALLLTGDWSGGMTYSDLAGTAVAVMQLAVAPEASKTITGATNATPIVVTSTAHGYSNGDEIVITGVGGNTAANGTFVVASATANTYALTTLNGTNVAGNGAYTSGGTSSRWPWQTFASSTARGAFRYARLRLTTTGTVLVTSLGNVSVSVTARRESSTDPVTTLASGPLIISLASAYTKAKAISANAVGTSPATLTYDRVEVSGGRGLGGFALRFGGASDSVAMADAAVHSFTSNVCTIEARFLVDALSPSTQVLIAKGNGTTSREYALAISPGGRLEAFVFDASNSNGFLQAVGATQLLLGTWNSAAMTFNGTLASLSVLLNGIDDTSQRLQSGTFVSMRDTAQPLNLAAEGGLILLNGKLCEARLWNVVRTASQILSLATSRAVGNEAGLVGLWHLNEGSGTTVADGTANAKTGTFVGDPLWRPDDGFDLYAFNASGAQIATSATWTFEGV